MVWVKRILLAFGVIVLAIILVVYIGSYQKINQTFIPQTRSFQVQENVDFQEGLRLAKTRDCYDGCHGNGVSGQDFMGLMAPELTLKFQSYSDSQLEQVIRQGVRPDGTSVFVMPSDTFQYLSDDDLGHIISFIRSLPVKSEKSASFRSVSFLIRSLIVSGFAPVAAQNIIQTKSPIIVDRSSPETMGKYLVFSTCAECHGLDLRGVKYFSPNLIVSSTYEPLEFEKLMYEGIATGGREISLMGDMARLRFSHFTDQEIKAIYAYLQSDAFIEAAFAEEPP